MTVDVFRASAPAAIAAAIGILFAYFAYKKFIYKWYGTTRKTNAVARLNYWLGIVACFALANGATQIANEFLYVAFNDSSIREDNLYKGAHALLDLPLILGIVGFAIEKFIGKSSSISPNLNDKHFAEALQELESNTQREGLWARCLANSDGNDSKAKSEYIRIRAEEISNSNHSTAQMSSHDLIKDFEIKKSLKKQNNNIFWGTVLCVGFTFGMWIYFISFHTKSDNELGNLVRKTIGIDSSKALVNKTTELPNEATRISPIQEQKKAEPEAVIKICQLYWNGWDLVHGDKSNEKPEFITFSFSRYDLKTLEISFPKDMVGDVNKQEFGENFVNQRLDLVMRICSLS